MRIFKCYFRLELLLLTGTFLLAENCLAQTATPAKIPAGLVCGPFVGNPPRTPSFADKFAFEFSNGSLTAVRPTRLQKGSDVYTGSIDATGKIKVSSSGQYENKSSEWTTEFAGQLQEKKPTVLQGTFQYKGTHPRTHKCTIAFLLPPADLIKAFLPAEAAAQPRPK
jgi:hypothetical protein